MTLELVKTIRVGSTLGECVLWHANQQAFWWTDIEECLLHRYHVKSEKLRSWKTPHRVASFGFVEKCDALIVAFDRGIALYDVFTGDTDWLIAPDWLPVGIRWNDGRVDRAGNFWVGGMVEDPAMRTVGGSLYRCSGSGHLGCMVQDIQISNGLC